MDQHQTKTDQYDAINQREEVLFYLTHKHLLRVPLLCQNYIQNLFIK